jgi:hypothetical protein
VGLIMTSRETVRRAIEFRHPDRVPISHEDTRFACVSSYDADLLAAMREGRTAWTDEWGVLYHRPTAEGYGVENKGIPVGEPLKAVADIATYPAWPCIKDDNFRERLVDLDRAVAESAQDGRYLVAGWFCLAEHLWHLEGMEQAFLNLALEPERTNAILDRVEGFTLGFLDQVAERWPGKIDGLYTGDDWGTQTAALIGIPHFREFFKPRYRRIISRAHELGMHVWMHSCGYINELLEELIDCGLDAINICQPLALGLDDIARRYAGRIAFEVPADIQKMLPVNSGASRAHIEAHVHDLVTRWGTPAGGIIGADYGGYQAIGTTPERAAWAVQAFKAFRYPSETAAAHG